MTDWLARRPLALWQAKGGEGPLEEATGAPSKGRGWKATGLGTQSTERTLAGLRGDGPLKPVCPLARSKGGGRFPTGSER